ncbi:SSI family serine proteinase inhibitor [Streptomyces sp. Wb2n-11]|uniref:SSI family serine proteinase inhibitor n=1 Tax=Streptomyces sp. Wb2n-11 TaxID=1030533 RepID=UPI000AB17502|nr:SSI family serine proteinase inhibitor [Streptomyces sp. Wb2n-11]
MLRRLALTAAASAAVLSAALPGASAAAVPIPLPSLQDMIPVTDAPRGPQDRLTVTTAGTGNRAANGTYELRCGPAGGTHPDARSACDRLDELARQGDPFAPVPQNRMCTHQHGGPATARITGTWDGQRVDASFNQGNGCEIARWRDMEPVLPSVRS